MGQQCSRGDIKIIQSLKMSEYYSYEPKKNQTSSRQNTQLRSIHDYADINQSNISQQTIIHRAQLYSPDKQDLPRADPAYDRTKTKKEIDNKLREVAGLVQQDREAQVREFRGVINAERGLRGVLEESAVNEQHSIPHIDLTTFSDFHQDRGTTFGPVRHSQASKAQAKQAAQREVQRQNAAKDNKYKKSAIDDLKTDRNMEDSSPIQVLVKPRNIEISRLPDGTYEMIEEIERKATEQIEGLRRDKIELMRKLNEEIKAHNQEKKLRIILENQLNRLKASLGLSQRQAPNRSIDKNQPKRHSVPHFAQKTNNQPDNYLHQQPVQEYQQQPQLQQGQLQQGQFQQGYPSPQDPEDYYAQEVFKLQGQNPSFRRVPSKPNINNKAVQNQKQTLRLQISTLTQKINQYKTEIERHRFQGRNTNDIAELQALYRQGQQIQQQTLRLLQIYNQSEKTVPLRPLNSQYNLSQANQDNKAIRAKLGQLEQQNAYLKENISGNVSQNRGVSRASLPVNARSSHRIQAGSNNDRKRIQEFQQILGDMRSAAR